jgi:hypothetical protein
MSSCFANMNFLIQTPVPPKKKKKKKTELGIMAQIYNPSTWDAGAGGGMRV